MKDKARRYIGGGVSAAVLLALAVFGLTYHEQIWQVLTSHAARADFIAYVQRSGLRGMAAFFALQMLQVVVAVLPGEPVELMAGLLYGALGGMALCLAGIFVSSAVIYACVRMAGAHSVDPASLHKYRFLRDEAHVKLILFLLFFIPGTPKDVLIYIGPFLPVRAGTFLALSTLARIPSVLTSTFAASQFAAGNWQVSAAVFLAAGAASVLCVLFREKILSLLRTRKKQRELEKNSDLCYTGTESSQGTDQGGKL